MSTLAKHPDAALSDASFRRFADFITRELGIKMAEGKQAMLQSRLHRRMRVLEIPSIEEYQKRLFDSPAAADELKHFIDAVTTNKTDFFREPKHFDFLTRKALPELDRQPGQPWLAKVWCAGCSSGEEPYTLAMTLAEYREQRAGFDFSIFGSDISTRVLETARAAVYEEFKIAPVAEGLRKRYLLRSRDPSKRLVRIRPELRARARFERINFMDRDYSVRDVFDCIFFRNVMIYFDKPTQEAVINKLCRNLRPGGFLFVGHSESLAGLAIPVESAGSAVYRKIG